MAITFSNSYSDSTFTVLNTIRSVPYTVPAGTDELFIFIYTDNSNTTVTPPNLVDYAGINATLISGIPVDAGGTGQLHFLYKITNPTAGTANLRFRHPTTATSAAAVCMSVDYGYTLTYSAYSYANSTSASVSIPSAAGDRTLFSLTVNNVDGTSVTETGGQTILSEGGLAANAMHQLSQELSTGSTNIATWTISSVQRWSAAAVNIKEDLAVINSINAGADIQSGQSAVSFLTAGFNSNTITNITTNSSGLTCSGIVNSGGGAGTFNLSDFVDGVAYPALPANVTYTFSDGTKTAQITEDLFLKTGWSQVTYASAVATNNRYFSWWLQQAGISIANGTLVYWPTTVGFSFTATGGTASDAERTVTAFVRDVATGLMSEWIVTINDAGDVVSATGLTSAGLTMSGLTMVGLTAVGL